jgi:DNA-3-methyladenine glycosylase
MLISESSLPKSKVLESQVLEPLWFTRPTCVVAADLVGKILCRQLTDSDGNIKVLRMRITETEAYIGEGDAACHAHAGTRTARTEIMYR